MPKNSKEIRRRVEEAIRAGGDPDQILAGSGLGRGTREAIRRGMSLPRKRRSYPSPIGDRIRAALEGGATVQQLVDQGYHQSTVYREAARLEDQDHGDVRDYRLGSK